MPVLLLRVELLLCSFVKNPKHPVSQQNLPCSPANLSVCLHLRERLFKALLVQSESFHVFLRGDSNSLLAPSHVRRLWGQAMAYCTFFKLGASAFLFAHVLCWDVTLALLLLCEVRPRFYLTQPVAVTGTRQFLYDRTSA